MFLNPFGLIAQLASVFLYAYSNIIDNYFANALFKRFTPVIFVSSAFGVLLIPVIFFFDRPHYIAFPLACLLLVSVLIEIGYQYPYYWSLRHLDTSIVISLFSLGKIIVPFLGFFFLGERLEPLQYLGFFMIILSAVALTLDLKKLKLNVAFFLMFLVSLLLSVSSAIQKYLFEQGMGWGTLLIWSAGIQFFIVSTLMLVRQNRNALSSMIESRRSLLRIFIPVEFANWIAWTAGLYALYLLPLSVTKGLGSLQAIVVLVFAFFLKNRAPNFFKEDIGLKSIGKKALFFILIAFGTICIGL